MQGKIIRDHDELARRVAALKQQGRRIVFTNGGFNLLHVGHIRSLRDAKSRLDTLRPETQEALRPYLFPRGER